jgi:adenylate cyclase
MAQNRARTSLLSSKAGERRLSAIMFTDIVGYTSLTQLDEGHALELLEAHNRQLRPLVLKFRGREIKTIGDAFLLEFDSALEACDCSVEIQKFFHGQNEALFDPWRIKLRIGIHLGDVVHRGGDIFGDTVNIASRIQPLADPEGICISGQVFHQIRNKFDLPLLELRDAAELKNVRVPVAIYKIVLPWEKGLIDSGSRQRSFKLDRNRIAVLPFGRLSPESEFFADGITEELISSISKITQLSVISRTSVMQYREHAKQISDIGRELKVGSILEGSVRKAGNRVRTSVQLIDIAADRHVWSEIYDSSLEDIFSIQSQIAQQVASSLKLQLLDSDRDRIERIETNNAEARSLYLRGRFYSLRVTLKSYNDAIKLFEQAIEKDPSYAQAYAGIADCFAGMGAWEILPASEVLPKSRFYATRALEIDDSIAEAHAALATVLNLQDWKFIQAEAEFRRAIELNPSLAYAHTLYSLFLGQFRRSEEAIREIKRALELDPLSAETFTIAGVVHLYGGRVEEARGYLTSATELDASSAFAYDCLGLCDVRKGRFEEGISKIKRAIELAGEGVPLHENDLAYAYAKAGMVNEAKKIRQKLEVQWERGQGSAIVIAGAYSNTRDVDKAFEWLFRAIEQRSGYLFSIAVDFAFENLWQDTRWQIALNKIGFAKAMMVDSNRDRATAESSS